MLLAEIKNDVTKFAEVISKILEVDVLIVDNNLKTISNTYRYPNESAPVNTTSIISQVIASGKYMAIEDRRNLDSCKECQDYDECDMKGLLCVPIFYKEVVVGAIALIVPAHRIHLVFGNEQNSTEFLEQMADLISSKLQYGDEYSNLNLIKRERELIMDSIDYAMVSMDEIGYITYYNKRFKHYFTGNEDCRGLFIRDVIPHKYIDEFLSNYTEFSDRLIYFEREGKPFYGFLSCMNISINGSRGGMLFIFKSVSDVNVQLTEIGYNNTSITFKSLENALIPASVINEAKRLSVTTKTVLIKGEKGTGKGLLAKAIHSFSDRADHCFINVNCEEASRELLEESIFGNERSEHIVGGIGKLQLAHNGTIYFYKIEQMPVYLQRRLAEILKSKTIVQAGLRNIKVDLRMIFSTSVDLEKFVQDGLFHDELYYRISKDIIHIPPLREDKAALRKLLTSSVEFYKGKYNKESLSFDPQALEALRAYSWPENVKELEKVMDFIIYHGKEIVTLKDLVRFKIVEPEEDEYQSIQAMEQVSIAALLATNRSRDEVANMLGISRATLYRKIKKYNL